MPDTPPIGLSHLLTHNSPPTPREFKELTSRVRDASANIARIQADSHANEQELQTLEEQLQGYRLALAPVRRLPLETLGEIFDVSILFTHVFVDIHCALSLEARERLVELCLVCRDWRETALRTHRLWSGVEIDVDCERHGTVLSHLRVISWLGCSGALPKTVFLWAGACSSCVNRNHDHPEGDSLGCPAANSGVVALLEHGPQLHRLHITCRSPHCWHKLIETASGSMVSTWDRHQLKWLSLDLAQWHFQHEAEYTSIFQTLPVAKHFELGLPLGMAESGAQQANLNTPPLFIHDLTTLSIGGRWSLRQFDTLLSQCINVELLTVDLQHRFYKRDLTNANEDIPILGNRRVLTRIHTLRFLDAKRVDIILLSRLLLPTLKDLTIQINDFDKTPHGLHLKFIESYWNPFVDLHSSTWQSICFESKGMPEEVLLAMFSRPLPSLADLTFKDVGHVDLLFESLASTRQMDGGAWLPKLQTLSLSKVPAQFRFKRFFGFLKGRLPSTGQGSDGKAASSSCEALSSLTFLEVTSYEASFENNPEGVFPSPEEISQLKDADITLTVASFVTCSPP